MIISFIAVNILVLDTFKSIIYDLFPNLEFYLFNFFEILKDIKLFIKDLLFNMINYISQPFKWFFKLEAASGLILLFAAIIALFISNSNLSELYFSTLDKYLFIGVNNFGLKLSYYIGLMML